MNHPNDRAAALDRLVQDLGMLIAKHWLKQQRSATQKNSSAAQSATAKEKSQPRTESQLDT